MKKQNIQLQDIKSIYTKILNEEELILAVLSAPASNHSTEKIHIRPLEFKKQSAYQITELRENRAFHQTLSSDTLLAFLVEKSSLFKQIVLFTHARDYHLLISRKERVTILEHAPTRSGGLPLHNRNKVHLLREGMPIPFLIELGIMKPTGALEPKKGEKFRQINRFLEWIEELTLLFPSSPSLHIVDFGCGKAYLTFALYYYLKSVKGMDVTITGIDLKKDLIEKCRLLAEKLGYQQGMTFIQGAIESFSSPVPVDLVVSLHACDTATDAALEKAIRWEAKAILAVPCCQHELASQVKNDSLRPLLKHGILKERLASLATDAARAQILEILGYQTDVIEFIDAEETPKNTLIRAIRRQQTKPALEDLRRYHAFKQALHILPSLETRFATELHTIGQVDNSR